MDNNNKNSCNLNLSKVKCLILTHLYLDIAFPVRIWILTKGEITFKVYFEFSDVSKQVVTPFPRALNVKGTQVTLSIVILHIIYNEYVRGLRDGASDLFGTEL